MTRSEAESHLWAIEAAVEGVLECLDGLSTAELAWRPPVLDEGGSGPGAPPGQGGGGNTLYALATHVVGNAEQNVVAFYAGQHVSRERRAEFLAEGQSIQPLRERWLALRDRLRGAVDMTDTVELEIERDHPNRGRLTGREVLLTCLGHANEHRGEAQLIRDLNLAGRATGG